MGWINFTIYAVNRNCVTPSSLKLPGIFFWGSGVEWAKSLDGRLSCDLFQPIEMYEDLLVLGHIVVPGRLNPSLVYYCWGKSFKPQRDLKLLYLFRWSR